MSKLEALPSITVEIEQSATEEVYFVLDEDKNVLAWNSSPDSPFFFGGMVGVAFISLFPSYEHDDITKVIDERKQNPVRMLVVVMSARRTFVRCCVTISYIRATNRWVGSIRNVEPKADTLPDDERAELVAQAELAQSTLRDWNVELRTQITETDRAIKALRQSREAFGVIIETAYDAFISTDSESVITEWNPKAEETFGFTRSEAVGLNLSEAIIPQRFREAHRKGMARFVETGVGALMSKRIEIPAIHKNGHEFPIELTFWHTNINGRLQFHAFLHDITERRAAQEQLTKFFDLVPNLMCITEAGTNLFVRVNKAWTKELGWTEKDLLGTDPLQLIHPDDIANIKERRLDAEGKGINIKETKSRIRHKDGHYLTLCWKSATLTNDGFVYSVAHILDEE